MFRKEGGIYGYIGVYGQRMKKFGKKGKMFRKEGGIYGYIGVYG
jgi:hypothetical protein